MEEEESATTGGQHMAMVDDNGDTVYVQLPPNITLDGQHSIVSTGVNEDGQQVFHILMPDPQDPTALTDDSIQAVSAESNNVIHQVVNVDVPADMKSGEDQEEEQQIVVVSTDDNKEMVLLNAADNNSHGVAMLQQTDGDPLGTIAHTSAGTSGTDHMVVEEAQVILAADHHISTGKGENDVALFQQALTLLHQKSGEQVIMTEDGDTIYIMQQEPTGDTTADEALTQLTASHLVTTTEGQLVKSEIEANVETITMINPETGDLEAVPVSMLETLPKVDAGHTQRADDYMGTHDNEEITREPFGTPVVIAPKKRGRGRPPKNRNLASTPSVVQSKPNKETEARHEASEGQEEPVSIGPRGQPRRKAAMKLLRYWALKEDPEDMEGEEEEEETEPSPIQRCPSVKSPRQQTEDKENMAPQRGKYAQNNLSDQDASVRVTIRDKAARQVMSDIGIHMVYYCKRCTFYSTQLPMLTAHIHECRQQTLTEDDIKKAAEGAAETSATLLLNASLQKIAGSGTGNNAEIDLMEAKQQDVIEIDEHDYAAEVDIVAEDGASTIVTAVGTTGEEVVHEKPKEEQDEVVVACEVCGEHVALVDLNEHIQQHTDLTEVGQSPQTTQVVEIENIHTDPNTTALMTTAPQQTVFVEETVEYEHQQLEPDSSTVVREEDIVSQECQAIISIQPEGDNIEEHKETAAAVATVIAADDGKTQDVDQGKQPSRHVTEEQLTNTYGIKLRCQQHSIRFANQQELTKHLVEDHWGVTEERVQANRKRKELETLEQKLSPPPKKRGRGRPPKVRRETIDLDDDVKDPDYEVPSEALLPRFRIKEKTDDTTKCSHCYKFFASPEGLEKHIMKNHTGVKLLPVLCQQCSKPFRNSIQLRNHIRTVHEGKKRRPCTKKYDYKKYVRKIHMCELCGYTTPEKCRLRNHTMSVHEGEYPYKCDKCEYKTNENADFKRHMHKHQGIKRYPCQFCSYRADQRWLLVNHCLRQHNIQLDKQSRNTRGGPWSNHRRRKDGSTEALESTEVSTMDMASAQTVIDAVESGMAFTQEIVIEQGMADFHPNHPGTESYIVPMVATNEDGEEVAMYTISDSTEEQVAIETIQEEEAQAGEVVYIQEDGTVLDQDQAALMLLAVAPGTTTEHLQIDDGAVHVETNYT